LPIQQKKLMQIKLTEREKDILRLIVAEHDCKEIAEKLIISLHTVQTHRRNIFKKLKAKSIVSLVNYAHKNNII
jgi:DNA-binding CsgD family transcriptional regulator